MSDMPPARSVLLSNNHVCFLVALVALVALATACGDPAAAPEPPLVPAPAQSRVPAASAEPAVEPAVDQPAADQPAVDPPAAGGDPLSRPMAGDIFWIGDSRALFLEIDPLPQPAGRVIGSIDLHHAHRDLRVIDEVAAPERVIVIDGGNLCDARVRRARRMHTLWVSHHEEPSAPSAPLTYLVLNIVGCSRGTAGISGVARADIRVRTLDREALTQRATPELVQAVRHLEAEVGIGDPLPSDAFRMLELPTHQVTFVVGRGSWVVRDGVALSGAAPVALIEAGPLLRLELQTASENWLGSLEDFGPVYAPRECEVIDDSGTSMNVRNSPRGNAAVVATLPTGARVTANGVSGAWFHVVTTPPGWAHQRGLRCGAPVPVE